MKLTDEQKKRIKDILDSKEFKTDLYEGLDDETRQQLGMFYTPADVCITMIEMYETSEFSGKNILDPCCGSGNLLIAMLAADADSDKVFGNDYDERAVKLCRKRINRACDLLGKPHIKDWQIHQGNALHEFALKEFREDYDELYFDSKTQQAERQKRLDDIKYNAYTDSATYKKKCKEESDAYRSKEISESYKGTLFEGLI